MHEKRLFSWVGSSRVKNGEKVRSVGAEPELLRRRRGKELGAEFNGEPLSPLGGALCKQHFRRLDRGRQDTHISRSQFSTQRYPGDPLNDFTIIRFLDRFVYKNPKSRPERKAGSVNRRRVNRYLDTQQLPVTSLEFLKATEKDLAPQDLFMQRLARILVFLKTRIFNYFDLVL